METILNIKSFLKDKVINKDDYYKLGRDLKRLLVGVRINSIRKDIEFKLVSYEDFLISYKNLNVSTSPRFLNPTDHIESKHIIFDYYDLIPLDLIPGLAYNNIGTFEVNLLEPDVLTNKSISYFKLNHILNKELLVSYRYLIDSLKPKIVNHFKYKKVVDITCDVSFYLSPESYSKYPRILILFRILISF